MTPIVWRTGLLLALLGAVSCTVKVSLLETTDTIKSVDCVLWNRGNQQEYFTVEVGADSESSLNTKTPNEASKGDLSRLESILKTHTGNGVGEEDWVAVCHAPKELVPLK
jgi:hypothetical protein